MLVWFGAGSSSLSDEDDEDDECAAEMLFRTSGAGARLGALSEAIESEESNDRRPEARGGLEEAAAGAVTVEEEEEEEEEDESTATVAAIASATLLPLLLLCAGTGFDFSRLNSCVALGLGTPALAEAAGAEAAEGFDA